MACVAIGCSNRAATNRNASEQRNTGITFHRFPFKEPERVQQWIDNIKRENWVPTKFSRICSVHFTSDFFDRTGESVRLIGDAVPTIFRCEKKEQNIRGKDPDPNMEVSHPKTSWKFKLSTSTSTKSRKAPSLKKAKKFTPKKKNKRRYSEEDCSDLETDSKLCASQPQYELSPKALGLQRVKPQELKKLKKSACKTSKGVSLNKEPVGGSSESYDDSSNDEEEDVPLKETDGVIVSIEEIKKKLAASLENIKRTLNANVSTTTTTEDKNCKEGVEVFIKEEKKDVCEETSVSPVKSKRLPPTCNDKVTQLPNNCVLYEFATPRRQVVLKLNHKAELSELQSQTLEDLLTSLGERKLLTSDAQEMLNAFGELPKGLISINEKSNDSVVSNQNFPEEVNKFATMLFLCSPEAYDLVCKLFNLPDKLALQARVQNKGFWPGFTQEALTLLKNKVLKTPADTVCCIMLDSVCVKRQWHFDDISGRWIGHVDFGGVGQKPCNADEVLLATEVLMFTVVGLGNEWKMPFGYFLHKRMSGELLKNLVQEAILAIEDCGLCVRAVVCNGSTSCIKMGKVFGCNIRTKHFNEMITSFPHPLNIKLRIHLVFGIRHALKLLMNLLKDKDSLRSSTYGKIDWKFFEQMFGDSKIRKPERVDLKHPNHVNFFHLQRTVRLCNSNFNSTLSDALELADELKLNEYFGCRATAGFAADVHRAFDLLNSRNPISSEEKPPIRLSTMQEQVESMMDVAERILGIELLSGECVIKEGRWMSVLLFAFTLKSVAHLATELMNDKALQYFCTYRVNLDHLDMVLSNLQRHGGWNGMPSPAEFRNAYKNLFERLPKSTFHNYDFEGEDLTVGQGEIYSYRGYSRLKSFHISDDIVPFHYLIDLRTDVLNRARRIIGEVSHRLSCPECMGIMLDDDSLENLKTKKIIINCINPSRFVMALLKISERVLKTKLMESNLIENERIVSHVYNEYLVQLDLASAGVSLSHMNEEPYHILCLIKVIIRSYITLRLYKRKQFKRQYQLLLCS